MPPSGQHLLWFLLGLVTGLLFGRWTGRAASRPPAPVAPGGAQEAPAASAAAEPPSPEGTLPAAAPPSALLIDVSAARAAGFNMKHADDLGVIQGIGPRTADLLRSNGIDSLLRIAQLAPADLLAVLERGGPSFALADPSTWPEQAALASTNRWPELRQRQQAWLRQRPSPADRAGSPAGPPGEG
jgi:predicted flap endonuclease-1-like 5' DNA nuclease